MGSPSPLVPRALTALLLGSLLASGVSATSASADPANPTPVSGTALPTAQVNGVVWSQVVSGGIDYVGGSFSQSQPAGAAEGVGVTPRANLFAYDVRSGQELPGFAATTNAQVRGVAASADGSRIYIVGDFTVVNGQTRNHIAALDRAGNLIAGFAPSVNGAAYGVTTRGGVVYFGGAFTAVGDQARSRAAAVDASGAVLPFAPQVADGVVRALAVSPDGTTVLLGGNFDTVQGFAVRGLAATDSATGGSKLWRANPVISNNGKNSAIFSLSSRGSTVYATGYVYSAQGGGGNLEGTVAMTWNDGAIAWIEDCHGDTYSSAPFNDAVYTASHAHDCSTVVGGWTNHDSPPTEWHRAQAFSQSATGVLGHWGGGGDYADFGGYPSPTLLGAWRPDINRGTYTGTNQGPWSVAAGDSFVVYGGEFTMVNGVRQTGLVRFQGQPEAPETGVADPPGTPSDPGPPTSDPGTGTGDPGTTAGDPPAAGRPAQPTSVAAIALGPSRVAVRWVASKKSSAKPTSFVVRATKHGRILKSVHVGASRSRAVLSGLRRATSYRISVVAHGRAGDSAGSRSVLATTRSHGRNVSSIKRPGAPTPIRVASRGASGVRVSWKAASAPGATAVIGYEVRIYRHGDLVRTVLVPGSTRARLLKGLAPSTRYQASVRAQNWAGWGRSSSLRAVRTGG